MQNIKYLGFRQITPDGSNGDEFEIRPTIQCLLELWRKSGVDGTWVCISEPQTLIALLCAFVTHQVESNVPKVVLGEPLPESTQASLMIDCPGVESGTYDRVVRVIHQQLNVDMLEIKPTSRIGLDLNADSLDSIELIMALEEEFGLTIEDGACGDIQSSRKTTVAQVVTAMKGLLKEDQ